MDSDWQEVHHIQLPSPSVNQYTSISNVGTIAFDTHEELLWIGDNYGRISSYYGHQLEKYTALKAHPDVEGPVQQFLFTEKGILSLAANSVHFMIRRGLTQWHLEDEMMLSLACMSFLHKDSSEILVAGCQKMMYKIDVERGIIIETIPTESNYTMMRSNRYICAATSTGFVDFIDPKTLQVMKTWLAHTDTISSMDAKNDFLITCGWSKRPHGPPGLDTLAKVYDLKRLEQLSPISFQPGAKYVQIHPKMSTASVVAAQNGRVHVIDIMNPNDITVLHVPVASVMTFMIMSPSGNVWAITDIDNNLYLWGSPGKVNFCESYNLTEFADAIEPVPHMDVDDNTPFASIGMPYYDKQLLSNWGYDRVFEVGRPPPTMDPDIIKQLRPNATSMGVTQIVTNPRKVFRNQIDESVAFDTNGAFTVVPKYISEKARNSEVQTKERRLSNAANAFARLALTSTTEDVPKLYEDLLISYGGRKGVADFDFEYYNNTTYSGLENHIANCYMNPLLQIFKYTTLIRNVSLSHVAGVCIHEDCLLCEMGFLFDMLEKAEGKACRATNFFKAYSSIPDATKANTVEETTLRNTLEVRLSAANRFILQKIYDDFRRVSPYDPTMDQILTTNGNQTYECLHCHNVTSPQTPSQVINLIYPDQVNILVIDDLCNTIDQVQNPVGRHRGVVPRFSEVLRSSFLGEPQSRGFCLRCRRYTPMASQRTITTVAPVLMINAGLDKSPKSKQMWTTPGWLPREIGITIDGRNLMCHEGEQLRPFRNYRSTLIFELVGVVASIASGERERQKEHLVSFVDVPTPQGDPQEQSQWHLFNDFLVTPVPQEEALSFSAPYKTPVILTYQLQQYKHTLDHTWKDRLDPSCLFLNGTMNLLPNPEGMPLNHTTEFPSAGTHIAIDAEFVVLQRALLSIPASASADTIVLRPTRQALGRVSILRGSGADEGVPFIDDYVVVNDPIADYVTQYSGIKEGDLDPRRSTRAPVSLKVTYKKLWLLLNLGCIFVGHGLYSDFRQINIHAPKAQVIDTSTLFYKENKYQRTLKLSLLARFFLVEDIQTGNHDSVEDARTALRLWRKFQEFEDAGITKQKIKEVYRYGEEFGFDPAVRGKKGHQVRNNLGGSSVDVGRLGVAATGSATPSGRVTPEVGLAVGNGPVTPVAKGRAGEGEAYFESPLR